VEQPYISYSFLLNQDIYNQRKKGRDLYDIYKVLHSDLPISIDEIIESYKYYMKGEVSGIPNKKIYLENIEAKMKDPDFLVDNTTLLKASEDYQPDTGYQMVKELLLSRME